MPELGSDDIIKKLTNPLPVGKIVLNMIVRLSNFYFLVKIYLTQSLIDQIVIKFDRETNFKRNQEYLVSFCLLSSFLIQNVQKFLLFSL